MIEFAEWLSSNPWIAVIGFTFAIFGPIIAIILFFKGRRIKIPCYSIRSINLIQDSISDFDALKITYNDESIPTLTATKILFWNKGRDTIRSEDIASLEPFRLKLKKSYKILDAKILYVKNEANKFSYRISTDKNSIIIDFEYIDYKEGMILQILHTGKSSKDVECLGQIKGCKIHSISHTDFISPINNVQKYVQIKLLRKGRLLLGIAGFMAPFMLLTTGYIERGYIDSNDIYLFILTAIPYWFIGIMMLVRRIPKGYELFEEN